MVDRSGEVHDVRTRNRGLKILILVLILLVLLAGAGAALYFFVFADNGVQLEFEPMPDSDSLIRFAPSNRTTGEPLAKKIEAFLEDYQNPPAGNRTVCNENYIKPESQRNLPCIIDVSTLNECSSKNSQFGYIEGRATPCVVVKLNKIVEWEPEPYQATDEDEAARLGMPDPLIQHIKFLTNANTDLNRRKLNTTWIACEGVSAADKENIGSLGYYYPGFSNTYNIFGGIPNMNFPYLEQPGYLSPFVFVKFQTPRPGVLIRIKCQAWAKNIDVEAGEGNVEFELFID